MDQTTLGPGEIRTLRHLAAGRRLGYVTDACPTCGMGGTR